MEIDQDLAWTDHRPIILTIGDSVQYEKYETPLTYSLPRKIPAERKESYKKNIQRNVTKINQMIINTNKASNISPNNKQLINTILLQWLYWKAAIEEIGLFKHNINAEVHKISTQQEMLQKQMRTLNTQAQSTNEQQAAVIQNHINKIRNRIHELEEKEQMNKIKYMFENIEDNSEHPLRQIKNISRKRKENTPAFMLVNNKWEPSTQAFNKYYKKLFNHRMNKTEFVKKVEGKVTQFMQKHDKTSSTITRREVIKAINKLRREAAPGLDGISAKLITPAFANTVNTITTIINGWWKNHIPPEILTAKLYALPKPNKPTSEPKNFRPISLLAAFYKIYEYIVQDKLHTHFKDIDMFTLHH